jgi:transcriptional regulator with XRE-family HTH domain
MSDESPGAIIRRARQEARLSQGELAAMLKVHKGTVGDWERNRYFPDRHYHALNKILHVSLRGTADPAAEPDVLADEFGEDTAARLRRVLEKRGETGAAVLRAIEDEFRPPREEAARDGSERAPAAGEGAPRGGSERSRAAG